MKLGKDVLLEIVDIFQKGLMKGEDVSQNLRELDLCESESGKITIVDGHVVPQEVVLCLTRGYVDNRK